MKRIFVTTLAMLAASVSFAAFGNVWFSSYTATADTAQALCKQTGGYSRHGVLHSVCITKADSGTFTVYNASSTAVNPVAVIQSTSALQGGCLLFDIQMSSGIVYTNSTAGTNATITYGCQ